MATTWTPQQKKVIDLRNRNILVSAAAGSGKTAVLVERIIERITAKENPINIDQLLIVTFTKAAAGEMRERIGAAIEKKVLENPDNTHLQKQMTLLYNAQITTIDSFCLNVIRNYFHTIDLDPSFRIADEAELTLLKSDIIGELLEEKYEEADAAFLNFVECYAASKSDAPIESLILKLFQFSMSSPWPHEWLSDRLADIQVDSLEQMNETAWMKETLQQIRMLIDDAKELNQLAINVCHEPDGPAPYMDAVLSDMELLDALYGITSYEGYYEALNNIKFARLSTKKSPDVDEDKKERVKALRNQCKDLLSGIAKDYFFQEPEEMLADLEKVQEPMTVLVNLVHEFIDRLAKAKEEANVVDFADIEHFALEILVEKKDGEVIPTNAALDLSEQFEEIMIDEYQDSNYLQEYILTSISRERQGHNNVFMVGDVKQSIYKFRLARPELFMEKYERYTTEDSTEQRVDLSKNFRSRGQVLDSVNQIFYKIMTTALGGIEYTKEVALYTGASFPEEENNAYQTELILVDQACDETELEEDSELAEITSRELEARAVAKRMKELVSADNGMLVTKKGELVPARYSDMVILLRTMSNWSEIYMETLLNEGIPAFCDTQSGYFQTLEIKTMLNYLRILDNPQQDIPFTAILYSPFGKLTSDELALIRISSKVSGKKTEQLSMYEAARQYVLNEEYTEEHQKRCKEKLVSFFAQYDDLREKEVYLSVHQLIQEIFTVTGYDLYVSAMPAGEQRKSNLSMLIQHALTFEQSSFHGLFQFIRYVEKLLKYEIDYGEAGGASENDNAVRIMSIHKSKGLEFPIVFVGGMGKSFNNMDAREKIVLHADFGLGPECIDAELRTKVPTILKKSIQKKLVLDNLGEELRILYVALTRAKEKLIMVGTVKDSGKELTRWQEESSNSKEHLMYVTLSGANSYFSLVGPAIYDDKTVDIRVVTKLELESHELLKQREDQTKQELLSKENFVKSNNEKLREELLEKLIYTYPFEKEAKLPIKTTVSELKKLGQNVDEELSAILAEVSEETTTLVIEEPTVPEFLKKGEEIKGADRGTLVHKIMECMDITKVRTYQELKDFVASLAALKVIDPDNAKSLYLKPIAEFLQSSLAERMRAAQEKELLRKEQQFVLGIPAHEVQEEFVSDDLVLIQGIIDLYFEEDGELVLVDYKTDRVEAGEEELLVHRYHKQLEYYERALTTLTGKKVKEKIIYSFALQKEIRMV